MGKTKLFLVLLVVTLPAIVFASSPTAECGAVEMPYQIDGAYKDHWLGYSVAGVGDINGDGKADFIVGAPSIDHGPGYAYVYSGSDGTLLFQLTTGSYDYLGESVAGAGDVNGDGQPDFICGAPYGEPGGGNRGSAVVFSGVDGSVLYRIFSTTGSSLLGESVAGGKDVNGDGKADFIVGAPGAVNTGLDRPGSAYVYSGADGILLHSITGAAIADQFGYSVAFFDDLNGDGKSEFGAGARWTDLNGFTQVGSAYVYSGADGTLIYKKDGSAEFDIFGYSMANAGDVNADGTPDFVVGSPFADPGGLSSAGSAFVYSGTDGSLLRRLDGFASSDWLGFSVAGAGDVNGDGFADIIAGAPKGSAQPLPASGAVFVFSGRDGTLLYQMTSTEALDWVGWSVAGLGDGDGDGKGDFLIATPAAGPDSLRHIGWVRVFKSGSIFADINIDGRYTPADVVSLLNTIYRSAPLVCPDCAADVNCDGILTLTDVTVEINAVFLATSVFCVL